MFLDEINSLPLPAQARLLRVLQDGEYERVGGQQALRADTRIVTASNRGLEQMVESGEFRKDLYYRLNVVPIHIPPLRERRDDLSALTEHLLRRLAAKYGGEPKMLSERAWLHVMTYDWPGNVRELENALERSFLFCRDKLIDEVQIAVDPLKHAPEEVPADQPLRKLKRRAAFDLEDKLIREALTRFGGNVSAAAREMGITPRAVHQKLKSHGIDAVSYRRLQNREDIASAGD